MFLMTPEYQPCADWISGKREKQNSWEDIRLACKKNEDELKEFLKRKVMDDDWPELSIQEWQTIVDQMCDDEKFQVDVIFRGNEGALYDRNQDNALSVPQYSYSCWQRYRNHLNWPEKSKQDLEDATIGILRRLSLDTKESGPIKGLVIGHVQSGKTANMEALMEMAADHGWNYFIILSGMIENLRQQTLRRINKDFRQNSILVWDCIDNPSKKYTGVMPDFGKDSKHRYYTVCLKNSSRLKNLIDWIHKNKAIHDDMRMLIIDDEADQASISNNAVDLAREEKERKGINKLIVNLVNDEHYKSGKNNGQAMAVNYIMYTATPYANFLNESTPQSLYPKDFIWTLKTSGEYIGPEQIFGSENPEVASEDGLDIKRIVTDADLEIVDQIYDGYLSLPGCMEDAICWFICSVSIMRSREYKNPVSMLIHTSQLQSDHAAMADAITNWFSSCDPEKIFEHCREIYARETGVLPLHTWLEQVGNYSVPEDKINDYPSFEEIEGYLRDILSLPMQHIKLNEEGNLEYHRGLHLVIDNCANGNGINGEDFVRLAYPDPESDTKPDYCTAFIIIGGSTLSRGLTIEGLVSTFFLRASRQADTLMQMGRWFGYRRGYELLPRLWMTADTLEKFEFLSRLETELRQDLIKYMRTEIKPSDYAPRILASPKLSWLRLTSKRHMTNAIAADMDYSGARPQTTIFDRDLNIQKKNIQITEDFISGLPNEPCVSGIGNSVFWRDIPLEYIRDNLLFRFDFCNRSRVFNEIEKFCEWLREISPSGELDRWSVIVAGKDQVGITGKPKEDQWDVKGYLVGKVIRSAKINVKDEAKKTIDIGALRSLNDCLADVPVKYLNPQLAKTQGDVDEIRTRASLSSVPQLIIYRIDKNSGPRSGSRTREKLNFDSDIIGLHICIPGDEINETHNKSYTVKLPVKASELWEDTDR